MSDPTFSLNNMNLI